VAVTDRPVVHGRFVFPGPSTFARLPDDVPIPAELGQPDDAPSDEDLAYLSPDGLSANGDAGGRLQRFRIEDDGGAEWAMRKLAAANRRIDEAEMQAEAWRKQIDEWEQRVTADPVRTIDFMTHHLTDYARRVREADPRQKSVVLPSGRVSGREQGQRVVVVKESEFVAWARDNGYGHLLRPPAAPKPDAKALQAAAMVVDDTALIDGEIVPGVEIVPPDVTYSVSPS